MVDATGGVSRKEKADSIQQALLAYGWSNSDRWIAEMLGVSNQTVSVARKRLEEEGRMPPRGDDADPDRVYEVRPECIRPCPLNDTLYGPIDRAEPNFLALVESIREQGLLEPIVVSADRYILSGHRRHAAVRTLGLNRVKVRINRHISYLNDRDGFLRLLASHNEQRVKTTGEQVREQIALMSDESYECVREFREGAAEIDSDNMVELGGRKRRSEIRDKIELRDAIRSVVQAEKPNWPLSDRAIHYRLLNITGLVRNDKTREPYLNNNESYNDVTNMLTRMRLGGLVPFHSIADETRPVTEWKTHRCVGDFVREQLEEFLGGYHRTLLQSQPNWIELLVEKNTVASQLERVAGKYTVPMTSGRGYSSLPPRKGMVDRFKASGREKLVVVVVSDFDPEGEDIPASFGRSLRDDFGIPERQLGIVKSALTSKHIRTLKLHEGQVSKDTSSRYKGFFDKHGERAWELESLGSDALRDIVEDTLRGLIDMEAFDEECEQEENEQDHIAKTKSRLKRLLQDEVADSFD